MLQPLPRPSTLAAQSRPDVVTACLAVDAFYARFPGDLKQHPGIRNKLLRHYAPFILLAFRYIFMVAGSMALKLELDVADRINWFVAAKGAVDRFRKVSKLDCQPAATNSLPVDGSSG